MIIKQQIYMMNNFTLSEQISEKFELIRLFSEGSCSSALNRMLRIRSRSLFIIPPFNWIISPEIKREKLMTYYVRRIQISEKNKTENYLVKACKNLKEANKILDEDQDPNCITYITDDKGNLY